MNKSDEEIYAFNAHYGWQIVNHSMYIQYPTKKLKLARDNPGKEIILSSAGCRKKQTPDKLVVDEVDVNLCVPDNYRQHTSVEENSCVWLAACLLIRSVDIQVAEIMNKKYRENPALFEWLPCFIQKDAPLQNSLYLMMKNLDGCPYFVSRMRKIPQAFGNNIARYLIQTKDIVLLLAQLQDTVGNNSHVVGINVAKRLIYDCQENSALPLSLDNLSRCCGRNRTFACFYHCFEIRRNNP